MTSTTRAECAVCGRRFYLTRDGKVRHHLAPRVRDEWLRPPPCAGAGQLPLPYDPQSCGSCMTHYYDRPYLTESAASVGIEYGRSTGDMLHSYLKAYHLRGHRNG